MSEAKMKFVCTKDENDKEEIFVFPKHIDHDRFAEVLCHIRTDDARGQWQRMFRKPISAGFVSRTNKCFGRSETLDLDSRPEDTKILSEQYYDALNV